MRLGRPRHHLLQQSVIAALLFTTHTRHSRYISYYSPLRSDNYHQVYVNWCARIVADPATSATTAHPRRPSPPVHSDGIATRTGLVCDTTRRRDFYPAKSWRHLVQSARTGGRRLGRRWEQHVWRVTTKALGASRSWRKLRCVYSDASRLD